MKFLIAISCLLAVAAAGYVNNHAVVIGAHGVPLEPAANVAARAFHHAAHAEANARNAGAHSGAWAGDAHGWAGNWAGDAHGWAGNGWAGNWAGNAWAGHAGNYAGNYASGHHYAGPQHLAVIGPNGVPVDTHENTARRAFHHAAHAEAVARNGDGHHGAWGYAAHAAPVAWAGHAVPVIGHNGVPVDTPEVAAAKSAHFAAHAAASHGHGYGHGYGHGW